MKQKQRASSTAKAAENNQLSLPLLSFSGDVYTDLTVRYDCSVAMSHHHLLASTTPI
jgi:hypothetical protein